jgi:signal transduction histidine kinase
MSHELRTPLNAILGYTEMVLSGTYGPLTDRVRDRLNRVYRNGQLLLEMINDVLDLSKIEAGEMRLSLEPLELAPLVMSAIGSVAPQVENKHLHLAVEIPANMPCAVADRGRLRQMMINLLSNAVKFTREGTITVRLQHLSVTEAIILEHPVLPGGEWVTISVEDTGIGIAPENFDIIFDAFRQVDGSTAREFGGTGLGLAITRHLAEMQGGQLWVQSELGRGSVFTLALPAAPVVTVEGKASSDGGGLVPNELTVE